MVEPKFDFSALHSLRDWWGKPKLFAAYVAASTIVSIYLSLIFPRSGSIVFLFLLTLAYIPFMFFIATKINKLKDVGKWWKHGLILIILTVVLYSSYAFLSPIPDFDQRFETQWEEVQGNGPNVEPYASPKVFKRVISNNLKIIYKILLLGFFLGTGGLLLSFYTMSSFSIFMISFLISKKDILLSSEGLSFIAFVTFMYVPHTILEILSYLIAGLAAIKLLQGFLIHKTDFKNYLPLFLKLLLLSLVVVLIAALFEAFIDPLVARIFFREDFIFGVPSDPYNLVS